MLKCNINEAYILAMKTDHNVSAQCKKNPCFNASDIFDVAVTTEK